MKVLIDRHHAGLFYSLQLLGDRLGWDVYTPVGREWWDEGYWRFGQGYGDERLVEQYLATTGGSWSGWKKVSGDIYWTKDRDYPDRWIHGLPLAAAKSRSYLASVGRPEWDLVIATVQDNQEGFARFAREVGAKYVYQVGNTRQEVDWGLDPLVIASSEVPLFHGVRYHQEIHPAFRWVPPTDRYRITSLVQYMPRMEDNLPYSERRCWPSLVEAAAQLRDFDVRIHGAGCPDGLINPTTAVAEAMAAAGWGWHDKVTGDGFGHVLWGWAATGRPLIGHASHYRGQLGEVLWQDGETCIDLDKHTTEEAVDLIRVVSATPGLHAAMCSAMRGVFEAHYDPERDAQAIREYLA